MASLISLRQMTEVF